MTGFFIFITRASGQEPLHVRPRVGHVAIAKTNYRNFNSCEHSPSGRMLSGLRI
jgi:hypothetical protein